MKFLNAAALAALSCSSAVYAAGWSFNEATLQVSGKAAGVGGGVKEKYAAQSNTTTLVEVNAKTVLRLSPNSPLTSYAITLPAADTLKITLTATEGKTEKRPHQAFLTLHDTSTGLEESFPFSLKESGKGKVELVYMSNTTT